MNDDQREALNAALVWLRTEDAKLHFNMEHWRYRNAECGTVMCIGGYAEYYLEGKYQNTLETYFRANDTEFNRLFFPFEDEWFADNIYHYSSVTPEIAANVLSHFLTTGEIDWAKVFGETTIPE